MIYRSAALAMFLILAACTNTNITPAPTATPIEPQRSKPAQTPQPTPTATLPVASATPTPSFGTVSGEVCYPSSETPPMTLYLKNTVSNEVTTLDIKQGQLTYAAKLPVGEYTAYALTAGMRLRGTYRCDADELCPFQVEPGKLAKIDICGWYSPPGVRIPAVDQPDNRVVVKLLQNMYARTGPHLSYPELGLVEAGTSLEAIKRSADGEWLLVEEPDLDASGWLHTPITQIIGDPNSLPIDSELPSVGSKKEQFKPAIWQSGYNENIVHFKGEIRDEAGRPVNGYSILLDNGTWSVLSHPTGASHHYPDVVDGMWDVVIPNETDAAGWWTMTVVRYECPDFEIGFNAQCKQFTPLSETKVIKVVHPDENVIEANWTCLDNCDKGLYIKAYRRPIDPIKGNILLYVEDRALKSSPESLVFDHTEMKTIYDDLPETYDGLKAYLTDNRPSLSPDGRFLIVNDPSGITWLADLTAGELREISRPEVPATWSPDSSQVAYVKNDTLYIYSVSSAETTTIWSQPDLGKPEVSWSEWITVKTDEAAWRISPSGQEVFEVEPDGESMADYLAQQGLPPTSARALSHDQRKVAYNLELDDPLENEIYILDLKTLTRQLVGPINGYRVPEIRWTAGDDLLVIGATNPKFPSGGAIFTMLPEPDTLPEILLESDTAYLVDVLPEPE